MKPSTLIKLIAAAGAVALTVLAGGYSRARVNAAQTTVVPTAAPKTPPVTLVPPTPISGGMWKDEFLNWDQLSKTTGVQISDGNLMLKVVESLNWKQTWTSHFALGEFFQTRAISDSVQLAPVDGSGQYYMTGVYTSTVFDAGRSVDWSSARWDFALMGASSVDLAGRTGHTLIPDDNWSDWIPFSIIPYACVIQQNLIFCSWKSDLQGIESSRYLQYRATFNSSNSSSTPILYDINFGYGLYVFSGTATSKPIAPVDLRAWKQVFYTATLPANTALTVDVFAPDGTLLLPSVSSGDSLASIDPSTYRSIQLRATFITDDPAYTPELNTWSLTWQIGGRLNFPVIGR